MFRKMTKKEIRLARQEEVHRQLRRFVQSKMEKENENNNAKTI